jgi:hypothetical protein
MIMKKIVRIGDNPVKVLPVKMVENILHTVQKRIYNF